MRIKLGQQALSSKSSPMKRHDEGEATLDLSLDPFTATISSPVGYSFGCALKCRVESSKAFGRQRCTGRRLRRWPSSLENGPVLSFRVWGPMAYNGGSGFLYRGSKASAQRPGGLSVLSFNLCVLNFPNPWHHVRIRYTSITHRLLLHLF